MSTTTNVTSELNNASQSQTSVSDLPPTPPESVNSEHDKLENKDQTVSFPLPPQSQPPTEVLEVDKKTPDGWVKRDPRLIRLTGVHPFNVEAPLTALYEEGFLTSPELFYVRNHGPVPEVADDQIPDWEFSIEGLVKRSESMRYR